MAKPRNNIIAALDIGTHKIACLIANIENKNVEILGIGYQSSQGIKSGIITDILLAENSIISAIEAAESMAGLRIEKVFVNISGNKISSHHVSSEVALAEHQINDKDISRIINESLRQFDKPDREIIHYFPLDYGLDGSNGIKDPRSMFGNHLTCNLHVITTPSTSIVNLANCLARCQLDIKNFVVSSYASGLAVLNDDEKELGSTVIDMGAGHTSYSIFNSMNLIYTDSIPIGGNSVTSDIARCLSTRLSTAERIKTLYGNIISTYADEYDMIDIPIIGENGGNDEIINLPKSDLTAIIKPRIEETFEMIRDQIYDTGIDKIISDRIILTGGASQLMNVKDLASYVFGKQVRIGYPNKNYIGLNELNRNPSFSTIIGTIEYAIKDTSEYDFLTEHDNKGSKFYKLIKWFQENF